MSNTPARFREADVKRAVKAVKAAGLSISRVEIEGGKLVIFTPDDEVAAESPLDAWRRQQNGESKPAGH